MTLPVPVHRFCPKEKTDDLSCQVVPNPAPGESNPIRRFPIFLETWSRKAFASRQGPKPERALERDRDRSRPRSGHLLVLYEAARAPEFFGKNAVRHHRNAAQHQRRIRTACTRWCHTDQIFRVGIETSGRVQSGRGSSSVCRKDPGARSDSVAEL